MRKFWFAGLGFFAASLIINGFVFIIGIFFPDISDRLMTLLTMCVEAVMAVPFLLLLGNKAADERSYFGSKHLVPDLLIGSASGLSMVFIVGFLNIIVQYLFLQLGMKVNNALDIGGRASLFDFIMEMTATALAAAVGEELLCRGLLFPNLDRKIGLTGALLLTSALFAVLHGNLASLPYTFIHGVMLCCLFVRTGHLWSSLAYHYTVNAYAVVVTFLVSLIPEGILPASQEIAGQDESLGQAFLTLIPTVFGAVVVVSLLLFALSKIHKTQDERFQPARTRTDTRNDLIGWIFIAAGVLICIPRIIITARNMIQP